MNKIAAIRYHETTGIPIRISWDLIAVDLEARDDWTFAHRISSSLEELATPFTRLIFSSESKKLEGGYYRLLKSDQVPPEVFKKNWLALTTTDGISARAPVAPECLYRFEPPAAPQKLFPTPDATAVISGPTAPQQTRPPPDVTFGPPDSAAPLPGDHTAVSAPAPERAAKKIKTGPKRPFGIEYVSSDEEPTDQIAQAPPGFLEMARSLLTKAPHVVVLKYTFFAPQFTYYIGVDSAQTTVKPADAVLHLGRGTTIKIFHVPVSKPPLGGLYEWVKKANAQPETSWITDPNNPHYHIMFNEVTFNCLFAAFQLICTPGLPITCKTGRKSI
jgi:hypothetical protein